MTNCKSCQRPMKQVGTYNLPQEYIGQYRYMVVFRCQNTECEMHNERQAEEMHGWQTLVVLVSIMIMLSVLTVTIKLWLQELLDENQKLVNIIRRETNMTNTYILPEYCEATRIFKPFTLKAIIRSFYNTNFHCKILTQNTDFSQAEHRQSSSGNVGDIGLW